VELRFEDDPLARRRDMAGADRGNLVAVTATLIDGKALGAKVREEVAASVAELGHVGLATVLVGDDPASHIYINLKQKAATEAGMEARDLTLAGDTSEEELLATIAALNADDGIDGLLVQLPLPDHIDENRVIEAIAPGKDVDGIHPVNAGRLYLGRPTLVPGTPLGIMRMLDEYDIPLEGARAVVVGRSAIVGKPMAHLLLQRNATVTICHSRTQDLQRHTLDADVLVAAVGRTHLISADMVKAGSTVIDVGMNRDEDSRKVLGDVDPSAMEEAAYMTPVPGGVGPMTIAMVLQNTVTAARLRRPAAIATPKN
jgi:methylenetetrahydrofolate dehydrogenase (NADP+)/methenyltetrahydrofolate cyclohydrolase